MSSSMKNYAPEDFQSYFGGAAFMHPKEKVPCYVYRVLEDGTCDIRDYKGHGLSPIPYDMFSFEDFNAYPPLGYRHVAGGKYLYRLCKGARRQMAKGLRENTVTINDVPEIVSLVEAVGDVDRYHVARRLAAPLMEAIFTPNYVTLQEGVDILTNRKAAIGLALSSSVAITLLLKCKTPYVLLFKGHRAAFSVDGKVWRPAHKEYTTLLQRTIPNIQLEKK